MIFDPFLEDYIKAVGAKTSIELTDVVLQIFGFATSSKEYSVRVVSETQLGLGLGLRFNDKFTMRYWVCGQLGEEGWSSDFLKPATPQTKQVYISLAIDPIRFSLILR